MKQMNCPNCGVYNPEDRTVCWRCYKELPKLQPKKTRNPQATQTWLYVIVAVFAIVTILQSCGIVKLPFGPQPQPSPTGYLPSQLPIVRQMTILGRI